MHRIYYISQGNTPEEHLNHISNVCQAGCRLVQLRLKDVSWEKQVAIGKAAKAICDDHETMLIVNDSVKLALELGASGVHLGKKDMAPDEAREKIPPKMIIGGTANTLEDCLFLIAKGVDYIGLGPFRYTRTKEELSPLLGKEGFEYILSSLREREIPTPVYAIGGILFEDFKTLYETGVVGMAVSGLLTGKSIEELKMLIEKGNLKKNANFHLKRQ